MTTLHELEVSSRKRQLALWALCITQIVGFGTLYYALPVALGDITESTGLGAEIITGVFSGSLVLTALLGILFGRIIDRYGSKVVMTSGSCIGTIALAVVGFSENLTVFIIGWALIGIASSMSLYLPAFAAVARWFHPNPVKALTLVTLLGALASTIFGPLVSFLVTEFGWQSMYLILSIIFGIITIPLHGFVVLPNRYYRVPDAHTGPILIEHSSESPQSPLQHETRVGQIISSSLFLIIAAALTAASLGLYAMHLTIIPLFEEKGMSIFLGSVALGIFGAGQLLGRIAYPALQARLSASKQISSSLILGAILVALVAYLGGPNWILFALVALIGAVRGLGTLIQANVVRELWPARFYGTLSGIIGAPITIASAIAPWFGTVVAQTVNSYQLAHLIFAGIVALGVVLAIQAQRPKS